MKNALLLLLLVASLTSYSQKVEYKVLSNEPPQTPRTNINLELVNFDMMQHSLEGMSMNYGLWGHVEIVPERIGAQFLHRRSWFAFGRLGEKNFAPNREYELGGYYVLSNKIKNKRTKITLKMEYSGTKYSRNYKGELVGSRLETETYILIPSDQKKIFHVRGGFMSKSHGNNMRYLGDEYNFSENPEFVKYSNSGLYAGIGLRTLRSIFIDSKEFGVQFNSIGKDIYLDVLVLPAARFKDLDGADVTEEIKKYTSSGAIGFRLGYKLFQIDKRVKTGKTFGMSGNFEAGIRPYTGIFLNAGIGLTIIK